MRKQYEILCSLILLLLYQSRIYNAQLATAFIKELKGLPFNYQNQGFVTKPTCRHEKLKPLLTFSDPTKFTTCLRELVQKGSVSKNADQFKRTDEIIRDHGYYFKTYNNLTSPDGYIQTMFRITGSPKSPPRRGKPAVLLIHGMTAASDVFLLLGERSLPFKLANAGYEVWLHNLRGTDYSMRHVKYDPNWNLKYWNFSFHEMAIYDIPMIIDLMLAETGTQKVFYIGHSMGAIIYSAAVAETPELNNKLHASFSFGSGGAPFHITNPGLKAASVLLNMDIRMQKLLFIISRGRLTVGTPIMNFITSSFCKATPLTCKLCGTIGTIVNGHSEPEFNYTNIPYLLSQEPNSASWKLLIHEGQNYRNCEFHKYDYGPKINLKVYGQSSPPLYNLSNIRAPMHLYYGEADDLTTVQDVKIYKDALPPGTVRVLYKVPWKHFNHVDFVIGPNVDTLIYDKVIEDMKLLYWSLLWALAFYGLLSSTFMKIH